MTNINDSANYLHSNGDSSYARHFGPLLAVTALPMCHTPHIALTFRRGVHIDLTPADAVELAALLPAALAALTVIPGTLAGHTWDAE